MIAAELLDLDPDIVRKQAQAYAGYANAISHAQTKTVSQALLSHYNAIAASFWAAVDVIEAKKCFAASARHAIAQASQSFEAARNDEARSFGWCLRASVLAACGSNFELINLASARDSSNFPLPPTELQASLLSATINVLFGEDQKKASDLLHSILARARGQQGMPTGVLQLPLRFAVILAELSAKRPVNGSEQILRDWGLEFGTRLMERLRLAQNNRLQWQNLNTRLLPIEPEGLLAVGAWRQLLTSGDDPNQYQQLLDRLPPVMKAYDMAAQGIFMRG